MTGQEKATNVTVMAHALHAPQPASCPLRLLSINPNGLRDPPKRRALLGAFQRGRWDALCLQEAHTVSAQEVAAWAQEGSGMGMPLQLSGMFANPLSSQSAGVVTLVKASAPATASRLGTAPEGGRLLDVVLTYAGLELSLLTCYAPCRPDERPAFFSGALAAALPPDRPVMACGDWNFVPGLEDVAGAVGRWAGTKVSATGSAPFGQRQADLRGNHGIGDFGGDQRV
jgi:exonuclease III